MPHWPEIANHPIQAETEKKDRQQSRSSVQKPYRWGLATCLGQTFNSLRQDFPGWLEGRPQNSQRPASKKSSALSGSIAS